MIAQNTPEWLAMRKTKIGASDAPIIMGKSPWATPYQLWERKLDLVPEQQTTSRMQRGHDLEDQARQKLEKMTGLFFLPQVRFHATIPYMMASLDAIDPDNKYIAEIKCPNKDDHSVALAGQVPEKYMPQLQHQLEVCELEMGYYFSFNGAEGALVNVYRDDKYIKKMLKKEKEFFECLQSWIPPEMTEKDYQRVMDQSWQDAAAEWQSVNDQLRCLEAKEKQLRDSIVSMSNKRNSIGGGIKLTRVVQKGRVEYSNIPQLKEVDLEMYRKKSTESFRISAV